MSVLNEMTLCLVLETNSFMHQTCPTHVIFCFTFVTPYLNHFLYFFLCFNYIANDVSPLLKKLLCNKDNSISNLNFSPIFKQSRVSELKNRTSDTSTATLLTSNFRHTTPTPEPSSDSAGAERRRFRNRCRTPSSVSKFS